MDPIGKTRFSHAETLKLLPWYVTGELSAKDHGLMADHLTVCDSCRAELGAERAIRGSVAAMPLDVELGWAAMRQRMDRPQRRWRWSDGARRLRSAPMLLVAQLLLLVAAVAVFAPFSRPASYHTLGSAPVATAANALVIFRPDARQDAVMRSLTAVGARIVDGPSETGALLLHVAPEARTAALARLKRDGSVALAEPIDS